MQWPDELPDDIWSLLGLALFMLLGGGGTWAWDKITRKKKGNEEEEDNASAMDAVVESFVAQIEGIRGELREVKEGMAVLDRKYTLSLRTLRAYRAAFPNSGIAIPHEIAEDL